MIDVSPNQNVSVHELPECIIESPSIATFSNNDTTDKGSAEAVSDQQMQDDNTDCMKAEKECMAASASSSDTFDIIDCKDLEHLHVSSSSSKDQVVAENVLEKDMIATVDSSGTNVTTSTTCTTSDSSGYIFASFDSTPPKPTCQSPCNALPRVNEDDDEEEEDCSCTTTGSRSPTPVHFEITAKGVKVISDRESFL